MTAIHNPTKASAARGHSPAKLFTATALAGDLGVNVMVRCAAHTPERNSGAWHRQGWTSIPASKAKHLVCQHCQWDAANR